MRKASVPSSGYIFRSKEDPDNFLSEIYMEEGKDIKEYYDEVPISVYKEHQEEAEGVKHGD